MRLIDADGQNVGLPRRRIEEIRGSTQSLMPDNTVSVITREEFADLISYLETLKFGIKTGLDQAGRAVDIPRLKDPVAFRIIHTAEQAFENPVWCGAIPGAPGQLLVLEHQEGRIWRLDRSVHPPRKERFADLGNDIHISLNQGLMCLAFHPDFEQNRRYFLEHEVKEDGVVKTTIVERRASEDGRCSCPTGDLGLRIPRTVAVQF